MINYGIPTNFIDEYLAIAGRIPQCRLASAFVKAVIVVFGLEYMRGPDEQDTHRVLAMNKAGWWPGILGYLDCMHLR